MAIGAQFRRPLARRESRTWKAVTSCGICISVDTILLSFYINYIIPNGGASVIVRRAARMAIKSGMIALVLLGAVAWEIPEVCRGDVFTWKTKPRLAPIVYLETERQRSRRTSFCTDHDLAIHRRSFGHEHDFAGCRA